MKATILSCTVLAASLFVTSFASAQSAKSYPAQRPVPSPPIWYRHASTYAEGVLRGRADVTRAVGESRYNSSLARINREEAIRRRLENRKQFAKDFFEIKKLNRDQRFQSVQHPTQQQLTQASKARLPQRLAAHEFQPALGRMNWPAVLQSEAFAAERNAIKQAMAERTGDNSGLGSENYRQVRTLVARLEAKLRGQLDQLSTSESIAARKFLQSVGYEASFPVTPGISGLALR